MARRRFQSRFRRRNRRRRVLLSRDAEVAQECNRLSTAAGWGFVGVNETGRQGWGPVGTTSPSVDWRLCTLCLEDGRRGGG